MPDFVIKQGDTTPVLNDRLTYSDAGNPNLSGHTINFVMRALTANTPTINAAATIVNAVTGDVSYTFSAGDTANAGIYQAYWNDLTAGQVFPTVGYLTVVVEENLTAVGGATIVALGDVKDYLNIVSADRGHDAELLRFIAGCTPVVENLTGPVLQTTFDEWYDGGQPWIMLRHRPVLELVAAYEYRGPTGYPLSIAPDPAHGGNYSVQLDTNVGRVLRRTAGGGAQAFPGGMQTVHIVYVAGRRTVPENIRLGTLELVRVNYQQTQQGGAPAFGQTSGPDTFADPGQYMLGFFVPNRVREMLTPNTRAPSIA